MADKYAVDIDGLAALRRALDRAARPDVNRIIKGALAPAAREAASSAPVRSGALSRSYRVFTRGNVAGIRSPLPYAGVVEYGGTINPRGADITFPRRLVVTRAAERQMPGIVDEIGDEIEQRFSR